MLFVIIHHILGSENLEQPWLKCIHFAFCPPRREYTCENDFEKLEVSKSDERVLFTSYYHSVKSDFQVNTSAP